MPCKQSESRGKILRKVTAVEEQLGKSFYGERQHLMGRDSYFLKSLRLFHIVLVSRVSRRPVLNARNVNMSSYGKTETETGSLLILCIATL